MFLLQLVRILFVVCVSNQQLSKAFTSKIRSNYECDVTTNTKFASISNDVTDFNSFCKSTYSKYIKAIISIPITSTLLKASSSYAADQKITNAQVKELLSVIDTANFIEQNCKTILTASRKSGKILYRGFQKQQFQSDLVSRIEFSSPALLLPNSFPEFGTIIADYFQEVNRIMEFKLNLAVYPRISQLATSNLTSASQIGDEVRCIFPVDQNLHYCTLRSEQCWWDNDWALPQGRKGPFFWKDEKRFIKFLQDNLIVDRGLSNTLSREAEVMFTADAFISVPLTWQPKLFRLLSIEPFNERVQVTQTKGMDLVSEPTTEDPFGNGGIRTSTSMRKYSITKSKLY